MLRRIKKNTLSLSQIELPLEIWFLILKDVPAHIFIAITQLVSKKISLLLNVAEPYTNQYWIKQCEGLIVQGQNGRNEQIALKNKSAAMLQVNQQFFLKKLNGRYHHLFTDVLLCEGNSLLKAKILRGEGTLFSLVSLYDIWQDICIDDDVTNDQLDLITKALFDLKLLKPVTYQLSELLANTPILENILYVTLNNDEKKLKYTVMTPSFECVSDIILFSDISSKITKDLSLPTLQEFLPEILRITTARKHTLACEQLVYEVDALEIDPTNYYQFLEVMRLLLEANGYRLFEENVITSLNDLFVVNSRIFPALKVLLDVSTVHASDLQFLLDSENANILLAQNYVYNVSKERQIHAPGMMKLNYIANILSKFPEYKLITLVNMKPLILHDVQKALYGYYDSLGQHLTPDFLEHNGSTLVSANLRALMYIARQNSFAAKEFLTRVPREILLTKETHIIYLLSDKYDVCLNALRAGVLLVDSHKQDIYFKTTSKSIFKYDSYFDFMQKLSSDMNAYDEQKRVETENLLANRRLGLFTHSHIYNNNIQNVTKNNDGPKM